MIAIKGLTNKIDQFIFRQVDDDKFGRAQKRAGDDKFTRPGRAEDNKPPNDHSWGNDDKFRRPPQQTGTTHKGT